MGCRSDYQDPTRAEINASEVLALLEETKTGILPDYFGVGSHSEVHNKEADGILKEQVPVLCGILSQKTPKEIASSSLELQLWWRDHQKADQERLKEELKEAKDKAERDALIQKMTPHERNLLGL